MGLKRSFEADAQLSEAGEPCMRALDHPSMLTEAVILLDASASDPGNDAAPIQVLPTTREVVALVGVQFVGSASRTAVEARHTRNGVDQCLEYHRIVAIRTRDSHRQRHASPIYNKVTLAAEFASIRWVRPCLFAPRGLETDAPSMLARLQSI